MNRRFPKTLRSQSGAALFVGLIFLLVLTILGLTAARVSTLDERMAGNFLRQRTAATATDNRLSAAVQYVTSRAENPAAVLPVGAYSLSFNLNDCIAPDADTKPGCHGEKWWQMLTAGVTPTGLSVPADTHTLIENMTVSTGQGDLQIGSATNEDYWRITSRSDVTGAATRSVQVIRQLVFVP